MKKLGLLIIPLLMCVSCENEKITIYAGEKANKCFNLEEQGYSPYLSSSMGLYGIVSLEEENISATFTCTKGEFLNTRFQTPVDEKSFLWTTHEVDQPDSDNYTYIDVLLMQNNNIIGYSLINVFLHQTGYYLYEVGSYLGSLSEGIYQQLSEEEARLSLDDMKKDSSLTKTRPISTCTEPNVPSSSDTDTNSVQTSQGYEGEGYSGDSFTSLNSSSAYDGLQFDAKCIEITESKAIFVSWTFIFSLPLDEKYILGNEYLLQYEEEFNIDEDSLNIQEFNVPTSITTTKSVNTSAIDVSFVFIERIVDAMPSITSKPYTYYESFRHVSFSFNKPITIAQLKTDYLANCSYYGGLNVEEIFGEYQNEKETTKLDDSYIIDKDKTFYPSKDFRFTIHAV